jgi:hypothetical protein
MSFGQDFLKGFIGKQSLKDYAHASKTFLTNGYELAPKNKFLFHVYFNINTAEIPVLRTVFPQDDVTALGMMVKTIQLPNYQIDIDSLNQYNRKRIIQKKINYLPVRVELHDDGGNLTRNLWYNYFSYYFKDPNQQYLDASNSNGRLGPLNSPASFSYTNRDTYTAKRDVNDWGFIGESYDQSSAGGPGGFSGGDESTGKPSFFKDITIYGFDQHEYAMYMLINPVIKEWNHDTYDYAQGGGVMQNTMTIEYETVKYYTGAVGRVRPDTNVKGFADPARYDTIPSPLSRPGNIATVLGRGGLLDAGIGILEDLQSGSVTGIIGAIQKSVATRDTFKGKNLKSIVSQEAVDSIQQTLRNTTPSGNRQIIGKLGGFNFPSPPGPR